MSVYVRFAPSPTGRIHVGNVRAALINYLFARSEGGKFLLRLDDTDAERSTEEYASGIQDDLKWLGLNWDETAKQSDRFDRYNEVIEGLKADGRLYACYETPEELDLKRKIQRASGKPPVYDRAALKLTEDEVSAFEAEGRKPHWRFKLSEGVIEFDDLVQGHKAFDLSSLSDPVLIRADGTPLYTLPSVIDDLDMGITHVIRGEDHVTNTAVQVDIINHLGGSVPVFAHYSLLTGAKGEGLSKRLGSLSIQSLREDEGLEPEAVISLLARLGTSDPIEPMTGIEQAVAGFGIDRLSRSPAKFDPEELKALNAKILHALDFDLVKDRAAAAGVSPALWDVARANIDKLSDLADWVQIVEGPVTPVIEDAAFIAEAATLLPDEDFGPDTWKEWTAAVKEKTGAKGKGLFMPLRLALTGRPSGPELGDLLSLIGPERAQKRLAGETA